VGRRRAARHAGTAQETSRPILERCGFDVVCTMYELESDAF